MADYCFDKSKRLLTQAEFSRVFDQPRHKLSSRHLLILAQPGTTTGARIGLVVGKKNVRLANQRNRIKRLVRETFRLRQSDLSGLDIVVLARHGIGELNNHEIIALLDQLWGKLQQRVATTSVSNG